LAKQEISALSVEGALFSTPRHRIEAHSESIVSSASYASFVSSLGFREPVSKSSSPKVALTEGSGLQFNGMLCWFSSRGPVLRFSVEGRRSLLTFQGTYCNGKLAIRA
jgi:hypothetical protein